MSDYRDYPYLDRNSQVLSGVTFHACEIAKRFHALGDKRTSELTESDYAFMALVSKALTEIDIPS